ncbi:MAG: hypothetical protein ACRDHW_17990, partial [Ktedonobacteraceae bacterium]
MRIKRHFRAGGALLIMLVLCILFSTPVQASALTARLNSRAMNSTTSVKAHIYLTNETLQPLLQNDLKAQLPQALGSAIAGMVSTLPEQDQGWATQMANTLIQPSATLLGITPQSNGLLATFRVSLYPGDPQPMTTSLLLGFSVRDASTLQVTALAPANNAQSLLSGPLMTLHIPFGSLQTIVTTPNCGDAALNASLTFPIAAGQAARASATSVGLTRQSQWANPSVLNTSFAFPGALSQQVGSSTVSASLTRSASTEVQA